MYSKHLILNCPENASMRKDKNKKVLATIITGFLPILSDINPLGIFIIAYEILKIAKTAVAKA